MPENSTYNEKELLLQLSQGDERAFRTVFTQHYDLIYSTAMRFLKQHELAQDAVQHAFMLLWENRSRLADINHLDNYIFITVRNYLIAELRKYATEEKYLHYLHTRMKGESLDGDDQIFATQSADIIHAAINQLPLQQQRVYRLSREEGMSQAEIARELNISLSTVKWHMREAMEGLRRALTPYKSDLLGTGLLVWFLLER